MKLDLAYTDTSAAIYDVDPKWDPELKALGGRFNPRLRVGPGYLFSRDSVDLKQLEALVTRTNSGTQTSSPRRNTILPREASPPKSTIPPIVSSPRKSTIVPILPRQVSPPGPSSSQKYPYPQPEDFYARTHKIGEPIVAWTEAERTAYIDQSRASQAEIEARISKLYPRPTTSSSRRNGIVPVLPRKASPPRSASPPRPSTSQKYPYPQPEDFYARTRKIGEPIVAWTETERTAYIDQMRMQDEKTRQLYAGIIPVLPRQASPPQASTSQKYPYPQPEDFNAIKYEAGELVPPPRTEEERTAYIDQIRDLQRPLFHSSMALPEFGLRAGGLPTPLTTRLFEGPPMAGASKQMQRAGEDRYQLRELGHLGSNGKFEPEFLYYAVFDGHGGARMMGPDHVAHYAESHLHERLARALSLIDRSKTKMVEESLKAAFVEFDRELHRLHKLYGSTATVVLRDLQRHRIYLINLGDSRSIVFDQNTGEIITATVDHDPSLSDERARIESAGGFVSSSYGISRVNGMLALSRAFGDFELKSTPELNYDPLKAPVSASPDLITIADDPSYRLILTSDAPYERNRYKDEDLVAMARQGLRAGKTPREIAIDMVQAIVPNTTDDVSIIIG